MTNVSDFSVRVARPEDFTAVGTITVGAYQVDGFVEGDGGYVTELADAASRAENATLLVATDGEDNVLGSVTFCRPDSPYAEVARPGEAEFRMLAVAPAARGRGVAEGLVRACLDIAREHGDTAVVLSSLTRMHTAHRLYERLGFRRSPELDHEPVPGIVLITYRLQL